MKISLVIPIRNEEHSIEALIESIRNQTYQPDEIVLVDGGSTDLTVEIIEDILSHNTSLKLIKVSEATPGKGRNIGIENAKNNWIALTDAGIKLEKTWLEFLANSAEASDADVVYGNYTPLISSLFEKCATIAYVGPMQSNKMRGKSVASCLIRKEVWEKIGGFPDFRAAEDLIFIDRAEKEGFKIEYSPKAMVYWALRPGFVSTFKKFVLYSKHNVWIGRQWDWHYGILRQYLIAAPIIALSLFHSWLWSSALILWFAARAAKKILQHRLQFGLVPLFNPLYFFGVSAIILTIDMATFIGWIQARLQRPGQL